MLPDLHVCGGCEKLYALRADGVTLREFDTMDEARAALRAACSATVQLGFIFHTSKTRSA